MTADEIRAAIELADVDETMWALLVRHEDDEVPDDWYAIEFHGWDGNASAMYQPFTLEPFIVELLLAPDPVPCTVAQQAGIDILNYCDRCDPDLHA